MNHAPEVAARIESEVQSSQEQHEEAVQLAASHPRLAVQLANLPVSVTGEARFFGAVVWMNLTVNLRDPDGELIHFQGDLFGFTGIGVGGLVGGSGRTVPFADLLYYGRQMYCEVGLAPYATAVGFKVGGPTGVLVGEFIGGGFNLGAGGCGGWGVFNRGWSS